MPTTKNTKVFFVSIPSPHTSPAANAQPGRSKRRAESSSQTATATIAVSGRSSMNTWACTMTSGVPSAKATASAPAHAP